MRSYKDRHPGHMLEKQVGIVAVCPDNKGSGQRRTGILEIGRKDKTGLLLCVPTKRKVVI